MWPIHEGVPLLFLQGNEISFRDANLFTIMSLLLGVNPLKLAMDLNYWLLHISSIGLHNSLM